MTLRLHKMTLSQFRSYETLRIVTDGAPMVVLTGANGVGKTNVLEAISLLVPGRGLRGATLTEMRNRDAEVGEGFAVAATVEIATGEQIRVGVGMNPATQKRQLRINGKEARGKTALAGTVAAVWLTPQMDRLFLEGARERRKFLDRLVFAFDAEHAARLNRHEKRLRERLALLTAGRGYDEKWMDTLERHIAADGVAIAAARATLLLHLEKYTRIFADSQSLFPAPVMAVAGVVDDDLRRLSALDAEDALAQRLYAGRAVDTAAGRSLEGAHRSDFVVRYAAKDMDAGQCSTGEQKGLMLAIVLAHARMMQAEKGFVPLMLFDEIAAHLDADRREQLFGFLRDMDGQVFLTGTDPAVFASLRPRARFFDVSPAGVIAQDVMS